MLNIDALRSQMFKIFDDNAGEICFLTDFNYEESNESVLATCDLNSGSISDGGGLVNVLRDYGDVAEYEDYIIKTAPEFGVRYVDGCLIAEGKDFIESFNAIVQASVILSARIIEQIRSQTENCPKCLVEEGDLL